MVQEPPESPVRKKSLGRAAAGLGVIVIITVGILWVLKNRVEESNPAVKSSSRVYICAETLKPFTYELKEGDTIPVLSPHSGKRTGYPAELCKWTRDGK